ncbi:hypothetical protein DFQ27_001783 [Actinomortierella ambigua]|uniref:Uncharacterized protein n=1 Tax=Actinomortierella ambigua TaxID=1343610 RepID=A0A9P6U884_9FUNG|nr:hypothetical protein DFQ27_001783 [Actinomortierella ambigua]
MSDDASTLPSPAEMAAGWANMQVSLRSLEEEVRVLRSLQQGSTGSFDPALVRQNEAFAYVPCPRHIQVCSYGTTSGGLPRCSLSEPLFLSPLSVEERKSLRASSHSIVGMDYAPPAVPDGVVLLGDQKPWDSQLRDIQFHLGQCVKGLDYFMDVQTRTEPNPSMRTALSFLAAFRRSLTDQASAITQTRLDNFFKFANLPCKAPPISASSAPHMVDPAVVRDLLASAEAAKKLWRPRQPETKSSGSKANKKKSLRRGGRKFTPKQPSAEQDESPSQSEIPSRPKSSAARAKSSKSQALATLSLEEIVHVWVLPKGRAGCGGSGGDDRRRYSDHH